MFTYARDVNWGTDASLLDDGLPGQSKLTARKKKNNGFQARLLFSSFTVYSNFEGRKPFLKKNCQLSHSGEASDHKNFVSDLFQKRGIKEKWKKVVCLLVLFS